MAEKEKIRNAKQYGTGFSDHLEPAKPLDLSKVNTVNDLVLQMKDAGFGARTVGDAADVLEAMVRDKKCFKVLTLSGAMTVAKMGLVVCDMIDRGLVDAVISTGALMAHGFIEGAGKTHFKYKHDMDDVELYHKGYDRVYDTLELERNLDDAEVIVNSVLDAWPAGKPVSSYELHWKLGEYLDKNFQGRAILKSAFKKKVPVYVPAFSDSEFGLDFAINAKRRQMRGKNLISFDPFIDLEHYAESVTKSEVIGIFTIGGGAPRNWAQQVGPYLEISNNRLGLNLPLRRFKYAVRICPEPASLGGLCLYGDTKIDLPRNLSEYPEGVPIKELVGKSNFPVYSYDNEKRRIVLANVRQVWATGKKKLYKLKFGWITGWKDARQFRTGELIASEDHKFMLRNGSFKTLAELKEGDRLMPFNSYLKADRHGSYRFVSLNNGIMVPEHRFIVEEMSGVGVGVTDVVHHIDHNPLNNCIENLQVINAREHARYHRFAQSPEAREKRVQRLKEITDPVLMQKMSREFWDSLSQEGREALCKERKAVALRDSERVRRSLVSRNYWSAMTSDEKRLRLKNAHDATAERWLSIPLEVRSEIVSNEKNGRWIKGLTEEVVKNALVTAKGVAIHAAESLGVSDKVFHKRMSIYGIDKQWIKQNCADNHYVISIEYFGEDETYDLTVDNTHNYAANGVVVSNSGCTYSEGISWGKFIPPAEGGKFAEVPADATIVWPMIVKAVLERLGKS